MSLSLPALAAQNEMYPVAITASDFEQIVRRYQKKVYRVLVLMLKNPEDADNLTQECFLRAYTSMHTFRGECSVQTWLLRIAMNLARDDMRNRRAGFWKRLLRLGDGTSVPPEQEPVSGTASPERGLIAQQELESVWRAVDTLSLRQKQVFVLRFAEEMELKQIAEVLNLRTGTVKAQLFRAVSNVREQVRR
jgi:RNA polymerase sigma-70 factor (ECF subfamily)